MKPVLDNYIFKIVAKNTQDLLHICGVNILKYFPSKKFCVNEMKNLSVRSRIICIKHSVQKKITKFSRDE